MCAPVNSITCYLVLRDIMKRHSLKSSPCPHLFRSHHDEIIGLKTSINCLFYEQKSSDGCKLFLRIADKRGKYPKLNMQDGIEKYCS